MALLFDKESKSEFFSEEGGGGGVGEGAGMRGDQSQQLQWFTNFKTNKRFNRQTVLMRGHNIIYFVEI